MPLQAICCDFSCAQVLQGDKLRIGLCTSALFFSLILRLVPAYGQDGADLFKNYCASCHEGANNSQAPGRDVLSQMTPEQILQTLEKGAMKAQAAERSRAQRRTL